MLPLVKLILACPFDHTVRVLQFNNKSSLASDFELIGIQLAFLNIFEKPEQGALALLLGAGLLGEQA